MAAIDEKNTIWIKQDPDSMEAASIGSESDSKRLIQHSSESHHISSEETDKQEFVTGELQIGAGESMSFTMFGIHPQQTEEEESLGGIRLKCSLSEKEFHKFSCSFCLQNFPSKYRLIMHIFIHIKGVQPPKYVCKSCGEVFCSNISMNRHLKMNAGVQALVDDHNYKMGHVYNHEKILEGHQEVSSMEQTGKQFSNKETRRISKKFCNNNYNTHTMTSDAEKRDRNDSYGSSSITGNVNHRVSILSYKCHVCGKAFTKLEVLKRHGLTHTESKPYKCDICGKCFGRFDNLKKHSLIHMGIKPHKCDICGKCFTRFDNLKQHSLIHMGTKPHKCDICGKSFTRSGDLKKHSVIHSGSKLHECYICGKLFARLSSLKQHSVTHAGSKSHKCDICGKSYRRLDDCKQHLIRHTLIKMTQM